MHGKAKHGMYDSKLTHILRSEVHRAVSCFGSQLHGHSAGVTWRDCHRGQVASPQDAFGERKSVVTVILRRLMLCRTDVLGTLGEDVQEAFPQHRLEIATRT